MSKIKLIANTTIIPKCLKDLDVSYGVSYFDYMSVSYKNIESKNNWKLKILSALNKIGYIFNTEDKKSQYKDVIEQISKNVAFVNELENEKDKQLRIQLNENNFSSKVIRFASMFSIKQLSINYGLNEEAASINVEERMMLIGLNFFDEKNDFYKSFGSNMKRNDIVDFVFLHEYSHGVEMENNMKYGKEETNSSFDSLYRNLLIMEKRIKTNDFSDMKAEDIFVKDLISLHKEIYADVGALLLMRNKQIKDGSFDMEKWEGQIKEIMEVRYKEKNNVEKRLNPLSDHFTVPGVEQLMVEIKKIADIDNKILNEEEIHNISNRCVKVGVGKTLIALIKNDNGVVPMLNTLFASKYNIATQGLEEDKTINHYKNAMDKIKELIPEEWHIKLKENLDKIADLRKSGISYISMSFDAALDYKKFKTNVEQKISVNNEVNAIMGEDKEIILNKDRIEANMMSIRSKFNEPKMVVNKNKIF